MSADDTRDGVPLTNLDQPLSADAGATKRELVDYLDGAHARILPALRGRPLSVIRVLRGQQPFMQKNLPRYTPEWLPRVSWWAQSSKREVTYALCDDRRSLLWFANQRAVEYHPTLVAADSWDRSTTLVLDIDPPEGSDFATAVAAAALVRQALAEVGMVGAVKTSGAKGLHVVVPLTGVPTADAAAATRSLAARAERLDPGSVTTAFIKEDRDGKVFLDSTRSGSATVVSVYSPRARPGTPVSFPVPWEELDRVTPAQFTMPVAGRLLADTDPWAELLPPPQPLAAELVEHGRTIPVARVQAMHEGKRRARKPVGSERGRVQPGEHGDQGAER
jgi:bifunctional non-homologous end joining protein LigD